MKGKVLTITIIAFIIIPIINFIIYGILTQKIDGADINLEARGIESPMKLILGGYLGLFFGFKYLGTINWLVVPVTLIYFYVVRPKLSREHRALIVVFIFTFILIALKGFFNQRYQLTLVPFVFFFLFVFVWKIYTKLNNPYYLREITLIFLFLNVCHYTWFTLFGSRAQEHIAKIFYKQQVKTEEVASYKSVFELSDYVDSLQTGNTTYLINNLPDFYYHTNKKGLYYWCQDDFFYTKRGITKIFHERTDSAVKSYLLDSLNCHYIYTLESYNKYNPAFEKFLSEHCTLLAKDRDNKQLFEINE